MFSRSHGSKNSGGGRGGGGGALTSHLFNRRLLAKSTTTSRAAANRPQSVGKSADVSGPGTPSGSGPARRQHADDPSSPVQLVSVRRNAEQATVTSPPSSAEVGGVGRRTKLGLSVAVVRGPSSTMNNGSSAPASSSTSGDVANDQHQLSTVVDNRRDDGRSPDTSDGVASAPVIGDTQTLKEADAATG